ncbi:uncharacterized protein LOC142176053 [Nicotiana tabacum]|uniref:Uncharacterized protein LOC142176053 n=1 Tax=Nicotiana tabacum TaxID=4097 RepID=A0AC58TPQ8_TOBAC
MLFTKPGNLISLRKNPFKIHKIKIGIKWDKPPPGTVKLNIDGAYSQNTMTTGLGGVFRNNNGNWIIGFHKLGHATSSTHAELMALHEGLRIAREMNFLKMKIETDPTEIIKLLYEDNQYLSNIILECRLLMHQLKLPTLRHNLREGNEVAHLLAKEVVKNFSPTKYFYHACPPFFVEPELNKNKRGICNSAKFLPITICNCPATLD